MSENKGFKRIKAEEASGLVGWELPQVAGQHIVGLQQKDPVEVTVVEEVIAAEKITLAELEEIRETARIEGLAAGLEEGRLKGLEEGRVKGAEEGKEQGYKEGFQQGEAEVLRLQALLGNMLSEFELPLKQQTEKIEKQLVDMVVSLAEATVGAELSVRQELLLQSISGSLRSVPEPLGTVVAKVNKNDLPYLEKMLLMPGVTLEYLVDDNISQGSYELQAASTVVEHHLDQHFATVVKQFLSNVESDSAQAHE
ncbi:FliH/SctL family protein [Neptuniibacter sp. QD72_48]|uniref:FliH/SctL family protein n=1 Tax=unclassified Neptuniibacter TaxID=2630693 RepID=UPI0039F671B6